MPTEAASLLHLHLWSTGVQQTILSERVIEGKREVGDVLAGLRLTRSRHLETRDNSFHPYTSTPATPCEKHFYPPGWAHCALSVVNIVKNKQHR